MEKHRVYANRFIEIDTDQTLKEDKLSRFNEIGFLYSFYTSRFGRDGWEGNIVAILFSA